MRKERGIHMYEFTNDCLIGIKEIDDEHARLFKMVNDAIAMSNELDEIGRAHV